MLGDPVLLSLDVLLPYLRVLSVLSMLLRRVRVLGLWLLLLLQTARVRKAHARSVACQPRVATNVEPSASTAD
jgi:hypothetical protein